MAGCERIGLIDRAAVELTGGEYVLRSRAVAKDGFSTLKNDLAQSFSVTAYENRYIQMAESRYPEAGIGGNNQRFKLSWTWANTR